MPLCALDRQNDTCSRNTWPGRLSIAERHAEPGLSMLLGRHQPCAITLVTHMQKLPASDEGAANAAVAGSVGAAWPTLGDAKQPQRKRDIPVEVPSWQQSSQSQQPKGQVSRTEQSCRLHPGLQPCMCSLCSSV